MRRQIGQHPAGRGITAADRGDQLNDRAERQLAAADPLWLQDAEQAGAMQVLDRLVGQAAQFLGLGGALAQDRHQRLGALRQLREIRRPTGPAKLWATLFRLGHPDTSFPRPAWNSGPGGNHTLPAPLTRGEMVDTVAPWRQECSRRAAGASARRGERPTIYMAQRQFPQPERRR